MLSRVLLFSSSRTMNRNQVHYYIQYNTNTGTIWAAEPVVCEWVMYELDETGGTREALTLMERELLYGPIVVKQDVAPPRVVFAITGLPEFPITVFQRNGDFVSGVKLPSGQLGLLSHVHGIMNGNLIEGLEVHATVGDGRVVTEWMPINRTMAA
jgi:hypothetical protein